MIFKRNLCYLLLGNWSQLLKSSKPQPTKECWLALCLNPAGVEVAVPLVDLIMTARLSEQM